jgi:hypothetical protein
VRANAAGRQTLESGHGIAMQQDFANFLFPNLAKKNFVNFAKKNYNFCKILCRKIETQKLFRTRNHKCSG